VKCLLDGRMPQGMGENFLRGFSQSCSGGRHGPDYNGAQVRTSE